MVIYSHKIIKRNEKYRINKKLYSRKLKHKGIIMSKLQVSISEEEYNKLKEDSRMLTALQIAGVDNWDGYSEAMRIFYDEVEDDENKL